MGWNDKLVGCALASVLAVTACATAEPDATKSDPATWTYKPTEDVVHRMTPSQARAAIEKTFPVWLDKNPFDAWADRLDGVSVRDDYVEFDTGRRDNRLVRLRYKDLSRIELVRDTLMGSVVYGVLLDDVNVLWFIGGGLSEEERRNRNMQLADAFYVLKNYPLISRKEEEAFQRAVEWFSRQNPKPQLPEEARRFRVQAEGAVREKRLPDAAGRYAEALKIAPWWPEGRFNHALVLAELGRYTEAIREMKRYLMLAPDAPNARAAKDQIYAWEDKAKP